MRLNALRALPKRRGKPKDVGERSVIAANILDRDFEADRPNQKCPTRDHARADVFDYIERFYNPRRRHSKLSYLGSMAFEAGAVQA